MFHSVLCCVVVCAQAWGWVQEMYGFTIACWLAGIKHVDLFLHMMAQVGICRVWGGGSGFWDTAWG